MLVQLKLGRGKDSQAARIGLEQALEDLATVLSDDLNKKKKSVAGKSISQEKIQTDCEQSA